MLNDPRIIAVNDDELEDFLNFIFDEECSKQEDEEDLSFLLDYLGEESE